MLMLAETLLPIAANHPAFAGHFPGQPIVPGVLLLDAALHAAAQARLTLNDTTLPEPSFYCQIASTKFLSPVQPGETLIISCTTTSKGPIRFDIACSGRQVATGSFVFGTMP